ncbi:uncharacterized protein MYCFIDRAFT_211595 [Pseudocercospora fijiensis CIRAD86]|uniref:NTF2-like domain-containing protein n=1 Tax=Pseudocercospora fijiensis (strain CIRAD86) TaxID=383855 RepID=M3AYT2_PSEFD|nr:uncharacterized protein MYCFIDRAFT_211595 [Pseudocercospora fijiensis CIRAD86]EME82323.1 hypothetical protein MYCFIDRAFT_211595 [Pseudocercospora fijiensis CIRAD86]
MRAAFFAGLVGLASAASLGRRGGPGGPGGCIDDAGAQKVADNFRTLITSYSNASAEAYLTQDFTDYSDSVNELINNGCPNGPQPLGSATFTSLQSFEAGQGGQPSIPFENLNVWHGCDFVALRWKSSAPGTVQPEQQVTGIIILEVSCNQGNTGEPWLINTVYSEFNSGAWLYDLGVFTPTCSSSKVKRTSNGLPIRML